MVKSMNISFLKFWANPQMCKIYLLFASSWNFKTVKKNKKKKKKKKQHERRT